jgi:hypothetical protein
MARVFEVEAFDETDGWKTTGNAYRAHDAAADRVVELLDEDRRAGCVNGYRIITWDDTELARDLLAEAVNAWPEFDDEREVSGADLVEWFAEFRAKCKTILNAPE